MSAHGVPRGVPYNRGRIQQVRNYRGLQYPGGKTPTDVDLVLEYDDEAWIISELKYMSTAVPGGQRKALARLCIDLTKCGKPVLCTIASHDAPVGCDIQAAQSLVTEVWDSNEPWTEDKCQFRPSHRKIVLRDAIDKWLRREGFHV